MIDAFSLQNNPSAFILPSGASRHLRHQLESAFVGTEIGIIQHRICIQNAYHADMVEIQPFGNHLRTNQYICLSLLKICNDAFIGRSGTGGIQVHTGNSSFRKQNLDVIFYFLRSESTIAQVCPLACRTLTGQLISIAAIMASQLVQSFMECQADITVLAFRHPSTCVTLNHRSKTTTVLKQDDLFFLVQRFMDILKQQWRERSVHALLAMQFIYIYRDNLRQLYFFIPFFQFHQPVLAGSCIIPGFNGRSSGTQQCLGTIHRCQNDCRVPGMIAGSGILLLIGILMFLVHNHQSKIAERKENGRTDSQNDIISFFRQLLLPDFHPFGIGEFRVVNAQTIAEYALQAFCNLGGKGYLRQQIQYLFSLPDGLFYQMDIDFCFSAGSHSMQQTDILRLETLHNLIMRQLLMFIQGIHRKGFPNNSTQPSHFLLVNFKNVLVHQAIEYSR